MARKNRSKNTYRPLNISMDDIRKEKKEKPRVPQRIPLNSANLHSDQPYQRPVRKADVQKIVDNYDPVLMDDIIVSFRDGSYYVIDGQHRLSALRTIYKGECTVFCKVFTGLSYTEEAELYNRFNSAKKQLTLSDKMRAHVEAKDDPEINDIKHLIECAGFKLNTAHVGGKTDQVSCLRASVYAYKLLGRSGFEWMLRLINQCWKGQKNNTHQDIIYGMALFLSTYKDVLSEINFVKRLERTTPQVVIDSAKMDKSCRNRSIRVAKQFLIQYNGNNKKNILPYRFNG